MTISSTTNRWAYTGDAVSTAFAYTNKILAAADLRVLVDGVVQKIGPEQVHERLAGLADNYADFIGFQGRGRLASPAAEAPLPE